jgi:hypothetical protein
VDCQYELPQIVATGQPPGRLTGLLHRWQEQPDEHTDDGDHHQQFDQGEGGSVTVGGRQHELTPVGCVQVIPGSGRYGGMKPATAGRMPNPRIMDQAFFIDLEAACSRNR